MNTWDIWKHGKYLDMWSLVHFASGFLLVTAFHGFGYGFKLSLLISLVLLSVWELIEWIGKIIEPSINVVTDIAVGLVGFFLGAYIYYYLDKPFQPYIFSAVLSTTLLLSAWGFYDFKKRGYR